MVKVVYVAHPPAEASDYTGHHLRREDMQRNIEELKDKPVLFEHEGVEEAAKGSVPSELQKGKILGGNIDDQGRLLIEVDIPRNSLQNVSLLRKIREGKYPGISLGMEHLVDKQTKNVLERTIKEASIVEEPDMPGTTMVSIEPNSRAFDLALKYLEEDLRSDNLKDVIYKSRESANKYLDGLAASLAGIHKKRKMAEEESRKRKAEDDLRSKLEAIEAKNRELEAAALEAKKEAERWSKFKEADPEKLYDYVGTKMQEDKRAEEALKKRFETEVLKDAQELMASEMEQGKDVENDDVWKRMKEELLTKHYISHPSDVERFISVASKKHKTASEAIKKMSTLEEENKRMKAELEAAKSRPTPMETTSTSQTTKSTPPASSGDEKKAADSFAARFSPAVLNAPKGMPVYLPQRALVSEEDKVVHSMIRQFAHSTKRPKDLVDLSGLGKMSDPSKGVKGVEMHPEGFGMLGTNFGRVRVGNTQ